MKVHEFMGTLRPRDASVAVALVELIKRADERGSLERGAWLSNVVGALHRLSGGAMLGSASEEVSPDEMNRYLNEHILRRLTSEGVVRAEPPGEAWERVYVEGASWAEIAPDRAAHVERLEAAARSLLFGEAPRETWVKKDGSTLRATGLVKAYRKRKVVNQVDVRVSQGEIVGLLGPNGAGKTTTFYMIVGLISPDEGRVYLDKEELTKVPMYQRARRGIGYLAQEPSVFRKLTVEQNVMAILETMKLPRAEKKRRLERLLDELGLKHLRKARAYSLSCAPP